MTLLFVFVAGLGIGAGLVVGVLRYARAERASDATSASAAATQELGALLEPLREELERYDQRLTSFDRERAMQFGALSEQLHQLAAASEEVREGAQQLAGALRAPSSGGRWGEVQLQRVVELAGMTEHCDFDLQATHHVDDGEGGTRRGRPDLTVRLPGGRRVVVDAKAPLSDYLDASNATDESKRLYHARRHSAAVREHVVALSRRGYAETGAAGSGATPEFVVLFLPGEAFFAAAVAHDPALLEDAAARGIILATPTTLIALLRAVAYGWREARMADGAREIAALGSALYERLAVLGGHMTELGGALDRAVGSYNRAVGSLESRVLVSARRFRELGVAADRSELEPLAGVGSRARLPQAPELAPTSTTALSRPDT